MAEEVDTLISGHKIKAEGVYDFKNMYVELQRWFAQNDYDWKETKFKAIDEPGGVKEIELKWQCDKQVDDYVSYRYNLQWKSRFSEVEATVEGVKKKMNKGSVELKFDVSMIIHSNVWEKRVLGKQLKQIYEKFLIRDRLDTYQDDLFGEAMALFDEIKAYLKLY